MGKYAVRINSESKAIVSKRAKERGLSHSEATDELVQYAASRLAALAKYVAAKAKAAK